MGLLAIAVGVRENLPVNPLNTPVSGVRCRKPKGRCGNPTTALGFSDCDLDQ